MERVLVSDGSTYEVRHAIRENLETPSIDALEQMARGEWTEDPELEEIPDDAQITHAQKFIAGIEFFAEYGYPNTRYCNVNSLRDGVWEFKLGSVRISFFDTDGTGAYTAKLKIRDIRDADFEDDFWWIPRFDEFLRLGHCFGKNSQVTSEQDLDTAETVRKEDLAHDRSA